MTQLPAYLQNTPARNLNESALLGIGSSLPPHIRIRGNTFTLVDASGAQQPAGTALDACIADLSDVVCKQYYAEKWSPDSNEPPLCWSANGVAPSREAIEPQHPTCADCRHNVRGSAVSAISGAAIKACRDEKWLALLLPQIPQVKFQLRLTPGSFKTWQSFIKLCEGNQTQITDVVTRITFQPGVNGVLNFQAVSYITEETAQLRNAGYAEKAFDVLVGRNDRPIQAALAAPHGMQAVLTPTSPGPGTHPIQQVVVPFAAPPAATPSTLTGSSLQASPAPFATPASPSEQPQRRKRRTQAEIAAATPAGQPAAPVAPFRPQPMQATGVAPGQPNGGPAFMAQPTPGNPAFTPQQPAAPGPQFGIARGVKPNPELVQALDGLFGKK